MQTRQTKASSKCHKAAFNHRGSTLYALGRRLVSGSRTQRINNEPTKKRWRQKPTRYAAIHPSGCRTSRALTVN